MEESNNVVTSMLSELDLLIQSTQEKALTHVDLMDLQTDISAIRYSLSGYMAKAERAMLIAKEEYERYVVKERIRMQALDGKLSSVKATDQIDAQGAAEAMRIKVIETKIDYMAIKNRIETSKDVIVAVSIKLGVYKQEMLQSNMQMSHP